MTEANCNWIILQAVLKKAVYLLVQGSKKFTLDHKLQVVEANKLKSN